MRLRRSWRRTRRSWLRASKPNRRSYRRVNAMPKNLAQISFADLISANEAETQKWRTWFEQQPTAVLDVPLSIALAKNVREFLLHIFAVELRCAERLAGKTITDYETLPTGSVADLFAIGERARVLFRDYLVTATDEDLAIVMEFPTRT